MRAVDVRLEGVGKRYRLGTRRSADTFWALRDVNLEVERGASLGVIGPNGAGKSTLMKLLAGITAPTTGRITLSGALSALIEVGSGFHPELTGRENVFLSGSILGMRRRDIAERFDEIVAFAGVERFIDTPVKWYSSGMYVRLGFAIAAHLRPDILLVDEVLAVGDAAFQARCLQRIRELQHAGVTILFISHDLSAVEQLCDHALLLDRGAVVSAGAPSQVVATYHRRIVDSQVAQASGHAHSPDDGCPLHLTNLTLEPGSGGLAAQSGGRLVVRLRYTTPRLIEHVLFEVAFYSADGRTRVATLASSGGDDAVAPGGTVEFVVDTLPFGAGAYHVGAVARDAHTSHVLRWWDGGTTLYVEASAPTAPGEIFIAHTSRVIPDTGAAKRSLRLVER